MPQPDEHGQRSVRPGAAALRYQSNADAAPRVTAKGRGVVAEKIIELARKNHVPIVKNSDLLMLLSKVELMDEIPEGLYAIVAEILAYVYTVNEQLKQQKARSI